MTVSTMPYSSFNFRFMEGKNRRLATILTAVLIISSVLAIAVRGLNFGIDFTGGTLVEVRYKESAELTDIRTLLAEGGYSDATVQQFGTDKDVLIRLGIYKDKKNETLSNEILTQLQSTGTVVEMRRIEFVGPQVGKELVEDGGLAILYTLIGILLYVSMRFEKRFSVGAVAALVHDALITVGIFALFQLEFDLTVLAAILAVIGYSLNDTIVVFDRIRENFLKLRKGTPSEVINISLNQTLIRTLMTSITTLLVVVSLFLFGGELIHGFATALMIGIVVGTYSSIYVASSLTLAMGISKIDLLPVVKEGEDDPEQGSQV